VAQDLGRLPGAAGKHQQPIDLRKMGYVGNIK
jgi:hypothetical protein